jgi:hypothetical protein
VRRNQHEPILYRAARRRSSVVSSGAVDSLPPIVYAANDERPRGAREQELCEKASSTDWLYMGVSFASFVGALYVDGAYIKFSQQPGVRTIGPALAGLTWGFTLGGGYLAQPKCQPDWVSSAPPEGDVRTSWQLALALGGLAAISAPILESYFALPCAGCDPAEWSVGERRVRVFAAAGGGFVGALLPYVLPPKTWRNAKELERLRAGGDKNGAFLSYTVRF